MDANIEKQAENTAKKLAAYGVKVAIMILPVVAGIYIVRQIDKNRLAKGKKAWGM